MINTKTISVVWNAKTLPPTLGGGGFISLWLRLTGREALHICCK
jgi:hypothetical protein